MTGRPARLRSLVALFGGVGASATGFIVVVAMSPLVAEDFLGHPKWSGVPSALAIIGTAFGTSLLARVMEQKGRRAGLILGYAGAAIAAGVAALAAALQSFWLFALAVFGIGLGYGASRLSRYAAADLYDADRAGSAIGWVVWAGTFGSVFGPLLLEPAQIAAANLSLPSGVGPFGVTAIAMFSACLVLTSLYPGSSGHSTSPLASAQRPRPHSSLNKHAGVALLALVFGQVVMILVMTMTPVHIRSEGLGLGAVGSVIAAHTFGMYALSPISGFLSDRVGRLPMILIAGASLSAAGFLGAVAREDTTLLAIALFLLGLGWNFGFVSGSALLAESTPAESRVRIQGMADSVVWMSAAAAGALSGVLHASLGYASLSRMAALVALVPATVIVALYRHFGDARSVARGAP